jgi:hypothetical protein
MIQFIGRVGNQNLIDDFANSKSISELRRLQTSFVRMSKIIDLSEEMPSSVGEKIFNQIAKVPIVGRAAGLVSSVVEPIEQNILSNLAVRGQQLGDVAGRVGQGVVRASAPAIQRAKPFVLPSITALQQAIDKEKQVRGTRTMLP